jgi:hypothetical protein
VHSMRERFTHAVPLPGRVTGLDQWPGWASWVQPNPYDWLDPTQF